MDPYIKHLNDLVQRIEALTEELDVAEALIEALVEGEDYELNESVLLEKKKWIQKAIKKEGALRKTMKTKEGKTIPVSKLKKAAEKGGKTGKRARLALTLRKLNEGGVVGQFNDADDKPGDEKVATQPDSLADLQSQLEKMQDQFSQSDLDLSDPEYRWSASRSGREMRSKITDLENKIRAHPETQAKIKAAEAARAAEGPGFFSRRAKDPDWLHDASQRGEMVGGLPAPTETPRERGLGLGPKRLPPTDYDLGRSSRKDR
jgi:hypothetical protein